MNWTYSKASSSFLEADETTIHLKISRLSLVSWEKQHPPHPNWWELSSLSQSWKNRMLQATCEEGFLLLISFPFVHKDFIIVYKASDGYNISVALNMSKAFPYVHCAVWAYVSLPYH